MKRTRAIKGERERSGANKSDRERTRANQKKKRANAFALDLSDSLSFAFEHDFLTQTLTAIVANERAN
jgi:hypothetical protein